MRSAQTAVAGLGANIEVAGGAYTLPSDRTTTWQPGVTYNGGIPNRTTVYTTVNSAGAGVDNRAAIQAAIDACPVGQVVELAAADFGFSGNAPLVMKSGITVRGTGTWPNRTRLIKLGSTADSGGIGGNVGPAFRIGPSVDFPGVTTGGANTFAVVRNFVADGAKGAMSVTLDSAAGLSVGDLVRVDELSNAGWQDDPRVDGDTVSFAGINIWASPDWRVIWQRVNSDDGVYAADFGLTGSTPSDPAHYYRAYTCPDRPICEMKEIAAINGNVVTFSTPLHISYRAAQSARVAKYSGAPCDGAVIDSVTCRGFDNGTFFFSLAKNCVLLNCEADYWYDKPFRFAGAFRCEARRCYGHDTPWPSNSAESYQFIFDWASADCLVEDCISIEADKVFAARAAGAGCVAGYNYLDMGNLAISNGNTGGGWQEIHANASHLTGPHHVLFEGNWAANADSDFTHGASVYITHFRNHYAGFRNAFTWASITYTDQTQPGNGPKRCAGSGAFGYWHSFVGNVLGLPNKMTLAQGGAENFAYEGYTIHDPPNVWLLGWEPPIHGSYDPQITNPNFAGSMIRDGNYDYLTNQVHWHGLGGTGVNNGLTPPAASALPDSLYLGSKPAFFGANTWPWVQPEGSTKTYTLPAKARYDAGTPFA